MPRSSLRTSSAWSQGRDFASKGCAAALQGFRTIAGMMGVITAVVAGSEAGLAVIAAFDAPAASFAVGGVVGLAVLIAMMTYQRGVWARAMTPYDFPNP